MYVVRGAQPAALEGEWPSSRRLVVVEFPSEERAREWYSSPEYAEALEIRRAALERRLLLADGVPRDGTGRELLGRFHGAMLDLSADDLADLHAPDAVYAFPLLSPSRPERYEGREAIREGFRRAWSAAPVRVDAIDDVVVHETGEPDVIVPEQTARATVTTTGKPFSVPFLLVIRHREGLITHVRDYADALRGAEALGRLPELVARLGE